MKSEAVNVRLTRKFSEIIDDVNLSKFRVGDVIALPPPQAEILIAEKWAAPVDDQPRATVADTSRHRKSNPRR